MKIVINGESRDIRSRTLAELLDECGISDRVATAVNEEFVPSSLRVGLRLKGGDRVEILAPMQGG